VDAGKIESLQLWESTTCVEPYPLEYGFPHHTRVELLSVATDLKAAGLRPSQIFEMRPKKQAVSIFGRIYRVKNLRVLKKAVEATEKH
jgi:hypothetical protein